MNFFTTFRFHLILSAFALIGGYWDRQFKSFFTLCYWKMKKIEKSKALDGKIENFSIWHFYQMCIESMLLNMSANIKYYEHVESSNCVWGNVTFICICYLRLYIFGLVFGSCKLSFFSFLLPIMWPNLFNHSWGSLFFLQFFVVCSLYIFPLSSHASTNSMIQLYLIFTSMIFSYEWKWFSIKELFLPFFIFFVCLLYNFISNDRY